MMWMTTACWMLWSLHSKSQPLLHPHNARHRLPGYTQERRPLCPSEHCQSKPSFPPWFRHGLTWYRRPPKLWTLKLMTFEPSWQPWDAIGSCYAENSAAWETSWKRWMMSDEMSPRWWRCVRRSWTLLLPLAVIMFVTHSHRTLQPLAHPRLHRWPPTNQMTPQMSWRPQASIFPIHYPVCPPVPFRPPDPRIPPLLLQTPSTELSVTPTWMTSRRPGHAPHLCVVWRTSSLGQKFWQGQTSAVGMTEHLWMQTKWWW